MASALTKVEISDAAHLKSLLSETDNPLQSIKEFQELILIMVRSKLVFFGISFQGK